MTFYSRKETINRNIAFVARGRAVEVWEGGVLREGQGKKKKLFYK